VTALTRRRAFGLADIHLARVVTQPTHEEIADAQAMLAHMKRYETINRLHEASEHPAAVGRFRAGELA